MGEGERLTHPLSGSGHRLDLANRRADARRHDPRVLRTEPAVHAVPMAGQPTATIAPCPILAPRSFAGRNRPCSAPRPSIRVRPQWRLGHRTATSVVVPQRKQPCMPATIVGTIAASRTPVARPGSGDLKDLRDDVNSPRARRPGDCRRRRGFSRRRSLAPPGTRRAWHPLEAAPRGELRVDPLLPRWLPDLTLLDIRLGRQRFDIRFWRDGEETRFEVLRGDPKAVGRSRFGDQFARLGPPLAW